MEFSELRRICLFVVMVSSILPLHQVEATTDQLDVTTLQNMYKAMNKPGQLTGWLEDSGDPCVQLWMGIECSSSAVIHIKLQGLGLGGILYNQLSDLHSLKTLDLSDNSIEGEIPFGLPPNITNLNLSFNRFLLDIPNSLSLLTHLRHLNLSHNMLSGPIGSVFDGHENMKEMYILSTKLDLSYNKFAGDLPSSFASLKSLTRLYLQNNEFTGSVVYLADLQLTDLNIQDNHFSGIMPQQFQDIPNLWIGGNKFDVGTNSSPWRFPFEKNPDEQNFTSPPKAESSAIEKTLPNAVRPQKKKGMPSAFSGLITGFVIFVAFGLTVLALFVHRKRARAAEVKSQDISNRSMYSIPDSSTGADQSSGGFEEVPIDMPGNSPPVYMRRNVHHVPQFMNRTSRKSFSRNSKMPPSAQYFTVAELESATNNFSEENLLGEGSLGPVYRAEFPDGRIFAVKNITTVSLSLHEEEQFLDVVRNTSILKHPNIVSLVGYCQEHGQHLLMYQYVRDLTLSKALHSEFFVPLTWNIRIQIAIGVAQALDYLHSLSPAMPHCNMKAANILLDDELVPRVCDSGLFVLRPLSRDSVKIKASEMAITDYGYIAPEHGEPGTESTKTDVYAFGVLLLELLTGKKPFDSTRPIDEQSLVQWASCRLHDGGSLEGMVDPGLRRSFSPKALSRYADIVSMCVQPVKEFRPPMSEVVEALTLIPKLATDVEHDAHERSFRSTHTRFLASPAVSFVSGC